MFISRNYNNWNAWNPDGWYYNNEEVWGIPFWWARLLEDENFKSQLVSRWHELRTDIYSLENIYSIIENTYDLLFEAQERNFVRWDVLCQYIWTNKYFGAYDEELGYNVWDYDDHDNDGEYEGYIDEVFYLKEWISARLDWIDNNIGEL